MPSDALQYGPNCIRSVTAFNAVIEVLERSGWAEKIEGGAQIDMTGGDVSVDASTHCELTKKP